ncbi:hypothetical protein Poly24_43570 [Rosistilla carotiformis]|uniref:Uncharacterized protein n=1 Tax=Rosistilla carotiformis TaxID=2528017 RepID=A0A518JYL7_9BACT|nr:hypothetical protein [Rosistilla carotiformis]QDV70631.1 hypothetical protein Poly24_43570 [Rosistilla carotiformis]
MADEQSRLDSEFVTLNAVRELIRLATDGDARKSTYDQALEFGAQICPKILGDDSLLKKHRESDMVRKYRQKARAMSVQSNAKVEALGLVRNDIKEYESLVKAGGQKKDVDRLQKELVDMKRAEEALNPQRHSEHQAIFRDARTAIRGIPEVNVGLGTRDFELPDGDILRLRVLHPDNPEHISGADIVYERHDRFKKAVNIVGVQYKIWENRELYLNEERMQEQLTKMGKFFCENNLCKAGVEDHKFRFPYCSAFLRPTDRLQSPDQKLMSTGEHVPICQIENVKTTGVRGGVKLTYENVRKLSLSYDVFEGLFTTKKIGSRTLGYEELLGLYDQFGDLVDSDRVLIHAQEFQSDLSDPLFSSLP